MNQTDVARNFAQIGSKAIHEDLQKQIIYPPVNFYKSERTKSLQKLISCLSLLSLLFTESVEQECKLKKREN